MAYQQTQQPLEPNRVQSNIQHPQAAACSECRIWEPPTGTSAFRRPCHHAKGFAPNGNRFSILAHLDHKPAYTKWALDIVQQPKTAAVRRRGKRGGKANRGKANKYGPSNDVFTESPALEAGDYGFSASDAFKELYAEGAQEVHNTTRTVGAERFQGSRWQVNKSDQETESKIPEFPSPCFTKISPLRGSGPLSHKRNESRFFPLSASVASTDAGASSPVSLRSRPDKLVTSPPGGKLRAPVAVPSIAQRAATVAAFRALSKPTISPPLTITMDPPDHPTVSSISPPVVSPGLTTSSAISAFSFGSFTPSMLSDESIPPTPPAMLSRQPFADTNPFTQTHWPPTPWQCPPSPPLSPQPFMKPSQLQFGCEEESTCGAEKAMKEETSISVTGFLRMGHANPCWCDDIASRHGSPKAGHPLYPLRPVKAGDTATTCENIDSEALDEDGWTILMPEAKAGRTGTGDDKAAEHLGSQPQSPSSVNSWRSSDGGGEVDEWTPLCEWPSLEEAAELSALGAANSLKELKRKTA